MIFMWYDDGSLSVELAKDRLHHYSHQELVKLRNYLNMPEYRRQLRPKKRWDCCTQELHPDDCTCQQVDGH